MHCWDSKMHPKATAAETITAPSVLKNIDKSTKIRAKNKTKGFLMNCIKNPSRFGGDEGTRTPDLFDVSEAR